MSCSSAAHCICGSFAQQGPDPLLFDLRIGRGRGLACFTFRRPASQTLITRIDSLKSLLQPTTLARLQREAEMTEKQRKLAAQQRMEEALAEAERQRAEEEQRKKGLKAKVVGDHLLEKRQQQREEQDEVAEKRWLKLQVRCRRSSQFGEGQGAGPSRHEAQ